MDRLNDGLPVNLHDGIIGDGLASSGSLRLNLPDRMSLGGPA